MGCRISCEAVRVEGRADLVTARVALYSDALPVQGNGVVMFERTTMQGAYFALAAYIFWGLVPIYFKSIAAVPAWEIVCHRIVWSLVLLSIVVTVTQGWHALRVSRRLLLTLFATAALLSVNWLIFIWAILHENIVETALGYYINPLVSVFLGMIFLGERLRPLQWCAIALAGCGIAVQLYYLGLIPWIALSLAFSFGFYGLLRKRLNMPSITGLMLEISLVSPFALGCLLWLHQTGELQFGRQGLSTDLLLVASGLVTSFPLLCFAAAVTRLSLTAAGMFQYIAPSVALLIALFLYDEPFGIARAITFTCIWIALALFTSEAIYHQRRISRHMADPAITAPAP